MSEHPTTEPAGGTGAEHPVAAPPTRTLPRTVRAAVGLAVVEAVAIVAYCVGLGISALQNPGSVSAAPVQIVIYLLFAAGILACARGLWLRRHAARTPFGVVQLFGVVVGWTLVQGDGDLTHRIGYAVLAVSIVGIALVMSPSLGESLDT